MLSEERRAEFREDVSRLKLTTGGSGWDRPLRILGVALIVVGVVAPFVVYNISLTQDDPRDLISLEILTVSLVCLAVVGTGLFAVGSLTRVLRLWLLRQLHENAARALSPDTVAGVGVGSPAGGHAASRDAAGAPGDAATA